MKRIGVFKCTNSRSKPGANKSNPGNLSSDWG